MTKFRFEKFRQRCSARWCSAFFPFVNERSVVLERVDFITRLSLEQVGGASGTPRQGCQPHTINYNHTLFTQTSPINKLFVLLHTTLLYLLSAVNL